LGLPWVRHRELVEGLIDRDDVNLARAGVGGQPASL
jgi:hypothetical protein